MFHLRVALLRLAVPPQPLQRLRADHVRLEPQAAVRERVVRVDERRRPVSESGARARAREKRLGEPAGFFFFFAFFRGGRGVASVALVRERARDDGVEDIASARVVARVERLRGERLEVARRRHRVGLGGGRRGCVSTPSVVSLRLGRRDGICGGPVARVSGGGRVPRRFETFVRLAHLAEPVHVAPLVGVERSG